MTVSSNNNSRLNYYNFTAEEQENYPVVTEIINNLTPEKIKKQIEEIREVEFPPELTKWIKEYKKVAGRNDFLWKWLYYMFKVVHLPYTPKNIEQELLRVKLLFTMFITLLDDVADRTKNQALLEKLLEIPFKKVELIRADLKQEDYEFFDLNVRLWNEILAAIKNFKHYNKYAEVFEFDLFQALNEMRYACVLNKHPYMINEKEYWAFLPYNMCLYVYSDMDLMVSSNFDIKKFGLLREIIWGIQDTARLGNWLSTWERELKEEDLSNIVFVHYFKKMGLDPTIKMDYLKAVADIRKLGIEKRLLMQWEDSYKQMEEKDRENKDLEIGKILGLSRSLLFFHLSNNGHI